MKSLGSGSGSSIVMFGIGAAAGPSPTASSGSNGAPGTTVSSNDPICSPSRTILTGYESSCSADPRTNMAKHTKTFGLLVAGLVAAAMVAGLVD